MKYYALCIINYALLLLLSGCIEEYEADISDDDAALLVVEGTICSGQMNKFYLSRTLPMNEYTTWMMADASVAVRGDDGSEYMTTWSEEGCYVCWIERLDPDVAYYLHIEADGEVYESDPQKPLPTEKIAEVCGVQNTPESDIDVLITPNDPFVSDQTNYYSWTYEQTWEVRPDYLTFIYFDPELQTKVDLEGSLFPERGWKDAIGQDILVGSSNNYDGQHIRKLKLYGISRGSEMIFHRYSGLIHQRAISKAEYEYELARRQASSEMGGLFTPLPSALPTNIHCLTSHKSVIGFIGCSLNTSAYRFFLNGWDFVIRRPSQRDGRLWFEDTTIDDCMRMVDIGMYLCEWEDERMTGGPLKTAWAFKYQLDVRSQGAYVTEPDFWRLQGNVSY